MKPDEHSSTPDRVFDGVRGTANRAGVSERTLREELRRATIPHSRWGRKILIRWSDVEAFLARAETSRTQKDAA